jgi:hypothetical protein
VGGKDDEFTETVVDTLCIKENEKREDQWKMTTIVILENICWKRNRQVQCWKIRELIAS